MTPQERQLIAELFDRLATLENSPRDPDAEAMIREGFRRAPNAPIRWCRPCWCRTRRSKPRTPASRNTSRIRRAAAAAEQPRGFLDNMRDSCSAATSRAARCRACRQASQPMGAPSPWSQGGGQGGYQQGGYQQGGYQQGAPMQEPPQQAAAARSSAPRRRPRPA